MTVILLYQNQNIMIIMIKCGTAYKTRWFNSCKRTSFFSTQDTVCMLLYVVLTNIFNVQCNELCMSLILHQKIKLLLAVFRRIT